MQAMRKSSFGIGVVLVFMTVISVPFLLGWAKSRNELSFTGLLLNPQDGYTYLAKMKQGYEGSWKVKLLHNSEPGEGAYIYPYYILLGHLARWTGVSLVGMYQIARTISAAWVAILLYKILKLAFPERGLWKPALVLCLFGSGMGWLGLVGNLFTADFWVAEAYPFLTGLVNAHFPFALGCVLFLFWQQLSETQFPAGAKQGFLDKCLTMLASLFLAFISPFGTALVLLVYGGLWVWDAWSILRQPIPFSAKMKQCFSMPVIPKALLIGLTSFPVLAYEFYVVKTDPVFGAWNQQNLTELLPWWDIVISFSPALLFAFAGGYRAIKSKQLVTRMFLVWLAVTFLMILIPFNLQRRFLIGVYIPLAGLAVLGAGELARLSRISNKIWIGLLVFLSLLTNLIVLLSNINAVQTENQWLFLTGGEKEAIAWLNQQAPSSPLVLTDIETGLILPAFTGARVVYGHPFETIQADYWRTQVEQYFNGEISLGELQNKLKPAQVDYILLGPRAARGTGMDLAGAQLVFENKTVQIYQAGEKNP